MEFERPLVKTLAVSLKRKLPVFQVLIGPRQVGKTTLIQQLIDNYNFPSHYTSADEASQPFMATTKMGNYKDENEIAGIK